MSTISTTSTPGKPTKARAVPDPVGTITQHDHGAHRWRAQAPSQGLHVDAPPEGLGVLAAHPVACGTPGQGGASVRRVAVRAGAERSQRAHLHSFRASPPPDAPAPHRPPPPGWWCRPPAAPPPLSTRAGPAAPARWPPASAPRPPPRSARPAAAPSCHSASRPAPPAPVPRPA